jgi:hypothetical protein
MTPRPGSFQGGFRGRDGYFDPPAAVVRVCEVMEIADRRLLPQEEIDERVKQEIKSYDKRRRAQRRNR